MGDRCHLSIDIHGHIEVIEEYLMIVGALKDQGLVSDEFGDSGKGYAAEFLFGDARFIDCECNYANIDDCEATLQEIGLPYYVSHEEGGDYGPGCWSWSKDIGKTEANRTHSSGAIIGTYRLKKLLAGDDLRGEIQKIVDHAELAEGEGLPPFSISDEVRAILMKSQA